MTDEPPFNPYTASIPHNQQVRLQPESRPQQPQPQPQQPDTTEIQQYMEANNLQIPTPPSSIAGVPGFLSKINNLLNNDYIKAFILTNPAWIEEQLEPYEQYKPIILTYLSSAHPDIYAALQQSKNSVGQANEPHLQANVRGELENPLNEEFEDIPDEVLDEAIKYMVNCRSKGYPYSMIAEKIRARYDMDFLPTEIQRYVSNYEEDSKEDTKQEINPMLVRLQGKTVKLIKENMRLKAIEERTIRKAEIDKAVSEALKGYGKPEKVEGQRVGLIRTVLRKLW